LQIDASLVPLVLASASPRRRDILERLGLTFRVRPASNDEPEAAALGEPCAAARELACWKARNVAESIDAGTIIGSDTIVAVGKTILGKPASADDARQILAFLSGKVQDVISGLCLVHKPTGIELSGFDRTRIYTKPMTGGEIDAYVATGECFGKAGAYAIQETGDRFVEQIEGSFDNVVGFPTELFVSTVEELARKVNGTEGL